MKTLLFTLEYPPQVGGVATYYKNLVEFWPKPEDFFVLNNNSEELIKDYIWPKWFLSIFKLKNKIKENKIDHVIVGQILPLGIPLLILNFLYDTKYSIVLHGMDFSLATKSERKKLISKKILEHAENIFCASTYTADLVKKLNKNYVSKIIIANPGVKDLAIKDPQLPIKIKRKYNLENNFILLTVGRLVKRKGVDMVLKSLPKVINKIPNLKYIILGNGPELENYIKKISDLKLKDNVILTTEADNDERNAFLNLCDIFIMPARKIGDDFEGFGIVYLEANLAGKPVIGGKSGGINDVIENEKNGILIDPENEKEIAAAIINLAENKELRKKLGELGRERALKNFSWEEKAEVFYKKINGAS